MMGFEDCVTDCGSVVARDDPGFQIDLVFSRSDKVITFCEIKYWSDSVDSSVIAEMERKCVHFKAPRGFTGERALITVHGGDASVKKSGYFHHIVSIVTN